ncbi:MAG: hypothetical protein ACOYCB_01125 [Fastidiosipilaceae bacterium]|jgi:Zn finger protein HypA/HybF involved in hydrogenase expression|nr:hypothetical protein [Clostridiaceae bacterium]
MNIYKCHECGYTKEAEVLPEDYICPLCDEPGTSFVIIDGSYVERKNINEPADGPEDRHA